MSRIGVLTGQAPGALKTELAAVKPIPAGPALVGAGIPADVLRQRPDVRAAERNLAAATARIGVAKAALYPNLAISGSIDSNAGNLGNLLGSITGGLFAGLTQAIFNGGRLRSQVRGAGSRRRRRFPDLQADDPDRARGCRECGRRAEHRAGARTRVHALRSTRPMRPRCSGGCNIATA